MGIFTYVRRHFSTWCEQDDKKGIITIHNVSTKKILKDLKTVWKTEAISKYMFLNVSYSSISFYKFYCPDIYFTLTKILEYKKRISKKSEIKSILEGLENDTWFKNYFQEHGNILDFSQLKTLKYTLLPPQREAVEAYNRLVPKMGLNGFLLSADVGTGKSVMAIAIGACLKANPYIVVCPKFLIDSVWVDAMDVQFNKTKKIWKSNSEEMLLPGYDVYIFHYEYLEKASDFFKVNPCPNSIVILDESHNMNNFKSGRTDAYLDMCKNLQTKNILHTSGTSVKALATETIPLFRAIDPLFIPEVEVNFKKLYSKSATRALEVIANRLGLISFKISKDKVMGDARPIQIQINVKMPNSEIYTLPYIKEEFAKFSKEKTAQYLKEMPHHEKVYQEALSIYRKTITSSSDIKEYNLYISYLATIRSGFDARTMGPLSTYCNKFEKEKIIPRLPASLKKEFLNSRAVYKYYTLKIVGEYLGILGRMRAELASKLIEYSKIDKIVNEAEKKTICFTDYVDTALACNEYFIKRGFKPALIYAETNKDVFPILEDFKKSDVKNPLIATIKSLSVGVTVLSANVIIFLNQPFRSGEKEQAAARAFRFGQDTQVYIYDIILDTGEIPNLSTRAQQILQWSEDQVTAILNLDRSKTAPINGNTIAYNLLGKNILYLDIVLRDVKKFLGIFKL